MNAIWAISVPPISILTPETRICAIPGLLDVFQKFYRDRSDPPAAKEAEVFPHCG